jgi:O-antigen/teichoic acid export membrane protein
MNSLGAQAKVGAFWVILQQVTLRGFSFVTNVILARLLFPEDFGIVAIAMIAWEVVRLFGNLGIGAKLIHQQEEVNEYATSAFWLNVIVSFVLAVIAVAVSPYVALFYNNGLVQPILILFAIAFFVQSFGSTHLALLNKELAFKKIVLVEVVLNVLSKLCAIGMAFSGFGVWSLVIPDVLTSPFKTVAFWVLNPWRPGFRLNTRYWKNIFRFGFNYLGADLTRYLSINGDYLIVGRMLGERSLGLYTFAYNVANLPFDNVVGTMARVAFPTFSKLQGDLDRFRAFFLKITKVTSLVSFPLLVEVLVLADLIIPLVYGDKWREAILPLKIIIGFVLFRVFSSPGGQVLFALGKPEALFKFNLIQVPFLLTAVFIGSHYGIVGVALGMSLVLVAGSLVLLGISIKPIGLNFKTVLDSVFPAAVSSAFLVLALGLFKELLLAEGMGSVFSLAVLIPSGLGVYTLILFMFFRKDFSFLWNLVWNEFRARFFVLKKTSSSGVV